jgi:hypothetical protein
MEHYMKVSLRTAHGKFLTAELNGTVVNDRPHTEPGPWEEWELEYDGRGIATLRSHHGLYLIADWGGGSTARAVSPSKSGPDELFQLLPQPDGRYAFRTYDGAHYLSAENHGAGWRLVANRTEIGSWETFEILPPLPVETTTKVKAPLRTVGKSFVDGDGKPHIPIACHFGEAFSAYVHCKLGTNINGFSLDNWRTQLKRIAEHYGIIRSWANLGYYNRDRIGNYGGWHRREVARQAFKAIDGSTVSATQDFDGQLEGFYNELAALGLMHMDDRGDLNSLINEEKNDHMLKLGLLLQTRFGQEKSHQLLAGLWAVNEAVHNGVHDPQVAVRMIEAFRAGTGGWLPGVVGLSDYDQSEDPQMYKAWSQKPANCITSHPLRDPGNPKRMLEHYFSNGYGRAQWKMLDRAIWCTEPIGSGSLVTVGQTSDVEALVSYALAAVIGGAGYTPICSDGIYWNGDIMRAPGMVEIPQAVKLLPQDCQHWDVVRHSGRVSIGLRPLVADDSIGARFDFTLDSQTGRFVGMAFAEHGVAPMLVERHFEARVIKPVPPFDVEWQGERKPGQMLPLSGRIARLVIGNV